MYPSLRRIYSALIFVLPQGMKRSSFPTQLLFIATSTFALCGCGAKQQTTQTEKRQITTAPTNGVDLGSVREGRNPNTSTPPPMLANSSPVQFTDVTQQAGIHFVHNNGVFGAKWATEVMGSGCVFFDYNNDGWQDIFLVNGRNWTDAEIEAYKKGNGKKHKEQHGFVLPPNKPYQRTTGALYRNNRNGSFSDVTKGSGLDIEVYGMGVTAGDYDNDGRPDLLMTSYEGNYLFHNEGAGRFREVGQQAGVSHAHISTSATWLDYDRDGWLDLFVCQYFDWKPNIDAYDKWKDGTKVISVPESYTGQFNSLYRNLGNGHFADVSGKAGIHRALRDGKATRNKLSGKALGVAVFDYNNDLWPDIVVANDRERNFLFRNNGNGTFDEVAEMANIAYSKMGQARAGMGIDTGDIDHSNRESVVVTNLSNEMVGLYRNLGRGGFDDIAPNNEVGRASFPYLGFGAVLVDVNNDGWLDIFVTNGHVNDKDLTRALQPSLLFLNGSQVAADVQNGTTVKKLRLSFTEVGAQSGEPLRRKIMGRGLAYADIDLDGDCDVLITTNGGAPLLLRNDGGNKNNVLRLVLRGTKSNRDAIGAVAWGEAGDDAVRQRVRSGSSYLSQSELPVTLGLGSHKQVKVVVRWPSGKLMQLGSVAANQILTVHEDKGILSRRPFTR
jgi:hypothetical protein